MVTGLNGSVTLANNGGDPRTVNADGAFTFASPIAGGAAYSVTVTTQPANQTCTVGGGGGNVAASNVTNVAIQCVNNTFTVGGTVTGLSGSLTLTNNGGDAHTVNASGAFAFTTGLTNGANYSVAVSAQPDNQRCSVTGGSGAVAAANITTVSVACDTFRVNASIGPAGGTLTHPDGAEVVIPAGALTQATDIAIARAESGWPTPLFEDASISGSMYEFTPHDILFAKPVLIRIPAPAGDVSTFVSSHDLGWSFADASRVGNRVELERNTFSWFVPTVCATDGTDPYPCSYPRGGSFATGNPAGSLTLVTGAAGLASELPGAQNTAGFWQVDGDTLTTLNFTMNYRAAPDCGGGHVVLRRAVPNGNPRVEVVADVPTGLNANGEGSVTIGITRAELDSGLNTFNYSYYCKRPRWNSEGGGTDWMTFDVSSSPGSGYSIGGVVTGLTTDGLVLQNGVRDTVSVPSGGNSYTFGTRLQFGAAYNVRITQQPTGARCTLSSPWGIVSGADVTNVHVSCTPTAQPPAAAWAVIVNTHDVNASLMRRTTGGSSLASVNSANVGNNPVAVVTSQQGAFAYVANQGGNSISAFVIERGNTPGLQPITGQSVIPTQNPSALVLDPLDGMYLWVTNYGASTVSAFRLDRTSGELTARGTVPAGGVLPSAIAAHPNGDWVYVVNEASSSIATFSVDRETGSLSQTGTALANVVLSGNAMLVAPSGTFAYALGATGNLTRLNVAANGALSVQGYTSIPGVSYCGSMALRPDSATLYLACGSSSGSSIRAYEVDASGSLTVRGTTSLGGFAQIAIAVEPGGTYLHATNATADTVSTFSIDADGELTFAGSAPTGDGPVAIAVTR
jgi:6-phosphogluconolactonase (cycloisomerase 2 family)